MTDDNYEYKEPVVGYVVVECKTLRGERYINVFPLSFSCYADAGVGAVETGLISREDRIIGVLPAGPRTHAIWNFPPELKGISAICRYEIDGVTHCGFGEDGAGE